MPTRDPRREAHFPAIEKRYGEPMKHWFAVMKTVAGKRYPEQIAHLRENFGFSQAHANALVDMPPDSRWESGREITVWQW